MRPYSCSNCITGWAKPKITTTVLSRPITPSSSGQTSLKSAIERVVAKLKKLGILLVEKFNPNKSDRTNFYSINYKKLAELLGDNSDIKLMKSLPQAEVIQYRKPRETIPSKRGNVFTENTKRTKRILRARKANRDSHLLSNPSLAPQIPHNHQPAQNNSTNCLWILVGFINSSGSNGWISLTVIRKSGSNHPKAHCLHQTAQQHALYLAQA